MKISQIRTTPLALTFKEPYYWAGRCDLGADVVLVEVETDEGITGIGESAGGMPGIPPVFFPGSRRSLPHP